MQAPELTGMSSAKGAGGDTFSLFAINLKTQSKELFEITTTGDNRAGKIDLFIPGR